ncbi:unnamed protein product, partial [Chrysoparadoxa australica]
GEEAVIVAEANEMDAVRVVEMMLQVLKQPMQGLEGSSDAIRSSEEAAWALFWMEQQGEGPEAQGVEVKANVNTTCYSYVFQELLSALLRSLYIGAEGTPPLSDEPLGLCNISNIELLAGIAASTYRGQEHLSVSFWSQYMASADGDDPLPPVAVLLEASLHVFSLAPSPLLQLLTALITDYDTSRRSYAFLSQWGILTGSDPDQPEARFAARLPVSVLRGQEPGNIGDGSVVLTRAFPVPGLSSILPSGLKGTLVTGSQQQEEGVVVVKFSYTYSLWSLAICRLATCACRVHGSSGPGAELIASLEEAFALVELMGTMFSQTVALTMELGRDLLKWSTLCALRKLQLEHLAKVIMGERGLTLVELGAMGNQELSDLGIKSPADRQSLRDAAHSPFPMKEGHVSFHECLVAILGQLLSGLWPLVQRLPLKAEPNPHQVEHSAYRLAGSIIGLLATLASAQPPWPRAVASELLAGGMGSSGAAAVLHIYAKVCSEVESARGTYRVTAAALRLFGGVLVDAGRPRGVVDLHMLFEASETEGLGREGLGQALAEHGYRLSHGALNLLWRQLGVGNDNVVNYPTFAQFVLSHCAAASSAAAGAGGAVSGMPASDTSGWDPAITAWGQGGSTVLTAEWEVSLLVKQLTEASSLSQSESTLSQGLVEFVCWLLPAMENWRFRAREHRWILSLMCLQILRTLLQQRARSMDALRLVLLQRLEQDTLLQRSLLGCMGLLATSAMTQVMSGGEEAGGAIHRLGDLTDHSSVRLLELSGGLSLLPLDFLQGLRQTASPAEVEALQAVSQEAFTVLERLLAVSSLMQAKQGPYSTAITILTRSADLSGNCEGVGYESAPSPAAILARWLVPSYTLVAISYMDYPRGPEFTSRSLPLLALNTLTGLIRSGGWGGQQEEHSSMIDFIGAMNAPALRKKVLSVLADKEEPTTLRVAALDLMHAAVELQPAFAAALLMARKGGEVGQREAEAEADEEISLADAISGLLAEGAEIVDEQPILLERTLRLLVTMWPAGGASKLGEAAAELADSESFWNAIFQPLRDTLGDPPDVREASAGPLLRRHCLHVSIRVLLLELLAAEMHAGGQGRGQGSERGGNGEHGKQGKEEKAKSNPTLDAFLRDEPAKRFPAWLSSYMRFDFDPSIVADAKDAAVRSCVDLQAFAVPPDAREVGDSYVYELTALQSFMGSTKPRGVGPEMSDLGKVVEAVRLANRAWSLADTQARLVRAWRVFMEVCVLRQQPGYSSASTDQPAIPGTPLGVGIMGLPASSSSPGSSSPGGSSDPLKPDRSSPVAGSEFSGDSRSFVMMKSVASKLAEEGRTGWAVAMVSMEMCEALVSMLHHQLHEVVQKAADPSRTRLRKRARSSRMKGGVVLSILQLVGTAMERLFPAVSPSLSDAPEGPGLAVARLLCVQLRLRLLTAALLLLQAFKGIAAESGEDDQRELLHIALHIFCHTCDTLALLGTGGSENDGSKAKNAGVEAEEDGEKGTRKDFGYLLSVCVSLMMELCILRTSIASGLNSPAAWESVAKSKGVIPLLLHHLKATSLKAVTSFQAHHDYSWGGRKPEGRGGGKDELAEDAVQRLHVILDFFVATSSCSLFLDQILSNRLLYVLARDPLLAAIHSSAVQLKPLDSHRGYTGLAERSPDWKCWRLTMKITTGLLHSVRVSSQLSGAGRTGQEEAVMEHALGLVSVFRNLILGSLKSYRLTLAVLEEQQDTVMLLAELGVHIAVWRSMAPELSTELLEAVRQLVRTLAVVLGDGNLRADGHGIDRHKSITHQEVLAAVSKAVSGEERREEEMERHQSRREGSRPVSAGQDKGAPKAGTNKLLAPPPLSLGSTLANDMTAPAREKPLNLVFNTRIERAVVAVLVPALTMLRRASPSSHSPYMHLSPKEAASMTVPDGTAVVLRTHQHPIAVVTSQVNGGYIASLRNKETRQITRQDVMAVRDEVTATPILDYLPVDRLHTPPDPTKGLGDPAFSEPPSLGHLILLCNHMLAKLTYLAATPTGSSSAGDSSAHPIKRAIADAAGNTVEHRKELAFVLENAMWLLVTNVLMHEQSFAVPDDLRSQVHRELHELFSGKLSQGVDGVDQAFVQYTSRLMKKQLADAEKVIAADKSRPVST